MKTIKIALLSDLHASPKSAEHSGESKLHTDVTPAAARDCPLASLKEFIQEDGITADFVVCPGDMTNRANPQALRHIWAELHNLKSQLQARALMVTVGNHDVDAYGKEPETFPRETLMKLQPRFPVANDSKADHYWAHGYYIEETADARFLVLNSCWLHEAQRELYRGAITSYTLEKIKSDLRASSGSTINVAVCHHHPHSHAELNLGADEVMRNGQLLLDALADHGPWLVIHGHKHHPKIAYATGQMSNVVVMASGSFSGRLEGLNASVSRNYFHLIELGVLDENVRGQVKSWAWTAGLGWGPYTSSPFPSVFGFGATGSPKKYAADIAALLGAEKMLPWAHIESNIPDLPYLMPQLFNKVVNALAEVHEIEVTYEESGRPHQIGKKL